MYSILCSACACSLPVVAVREGSCVVQEACRRRSDACWQDATQNLVVDVSDFGTNGGASAPSPRPLPHAYIRVSLCGIPSAHPGAPSLGDLIVGDTVCIGSGEIFNMTGGYIPYLRSWVCGRDEGQSVVDLKRQVSRASTECGLGAALHDSELRRTTVLFGGAMDDGNICPSLSNAQVRFFEKGILVSHNGEAQQRSFLEST